MGYKIIFLKSDNSYKARTRKYADGSEPSDQAVVDHLKACVSKTVTDYDIVTLTEAQWAAKDGDDYKTWAWNSGDPIGDTPVVGPKDYLAVTLTDLSDQALPDTAPVDGIPEIVKSTGQCKIKIQKKSGVDDSDMTGAEDNEALQVWANRAGGLSSLTPSLANGFSEVVLSAGPVMDLIDITVFDPAGNLKRGTAKLQVK